jgi:hypothetical protein
MGSTKLFTPIITAGGCCPDPPPAGSLAMIYMEETCKIKASCINPLTGFFWTQADIRMITDVAKRPAGYILPTVENPYAESVTIGVPIEFEVGYGYVKYAQELDSIENKGKSVGKVGQLTIENEIDGIFIGTEAQTRGFIEKIKNGCLTVCIRRKGLNGERLILGQKDAKAQFTNIAYTSGKKVGDDCHVTFTISDGGAIPLMTYAQGLAFPERTE